MISVLQPAEVNLPGHINSVSIYPAAGIPSPAGVFDSIRNVAINQDYNYNRTRQGYLYGIYEVLAASPRFQRITVADSVFADSIYERTVSWDILKQICQHDSTEAVLLVNRVVAYDSVNYLDESRTEESIVDSFEKYFYSCTLFFRMISNIRLAFYEPAVQMKSVHYFFTDTIDLYSNNSCNDVSSADSMQDILYNACFYTGRKVGARLAPVWNDEVRRVFYTGTDLNLGEASMLARNNQWKEAGQIWETLSKNKNKRTASKASFNMALAWEQEDDLYQALFWLDYADSLYNNPRTAAYRKILEQRLRTRALLDQQFTAE
jgi:hypothetical protein